MKGAQDSRVGAGDRHTGLGGIDRPSERDIVRVGGIRPGGAAVRRELSLVGCAAVGSIGMGSGGVARLVLLRVIIVDVRGPRISGRQELKSIGEVIFEGHVSEVYADPTVGCRYGAGGGEGARIHQNDRGAKGILDDAVHQIVRWRSYFLHVDFHFPHIDIRS